MFFLVFNIASVESTARNTASLQKRGIKPEYFKFLQKICPVQVDTRNVLDIDSAISKFQKKFKISRPKAQQVIKDFIDEDFLSVGYDNQLQMNLLANPIRNKIYKLIQQYPGIYLSIIRAHLAIGSNQTVWHLNFLVKFEYVDVTSFGKIKAFSIFNSNQKYVLIGFLVLKKTLRDLLTILHKDHNGFTLQELMEKNKKSRSSLVYTLKKLEYLGVIEKNEETMLKYKFSFIYFSIFVETLIKFQVIFKSN